MLWNWRVRERERGLMEKGGRDKREKAEEISKREETPFGEIQRPAVEKLAVGYLKREEVRNLGRLECIL